MKFAPAIAFDFRPCPHVAVAVGLTGALALLAIALCGLDLSVRIVLAAFAAMFTVWAIRKHMNPGFVRVARGESGWLLVDAQGDEQPARLHAHVRRGPLLVLDMRDGRDRRRCFVLTPGNSDAELRRRLILVLAAETGSGSTRQDIRGPLKAVE